MSERHGVPFTLCAGERNLVERSVVLLCTLYCLLLISLPSSYGTSVAWLIALSGALRGGMWRVFYVRYRFSLWGIAALIVINAFFARFPAKVVPGAGEFVRSVLFMLSAMYVMQHCSSRAVIVALRALVVVTVMGCLSIYILHAGSQDAMNDIYNWSLDYIGNVHNLINVVAMAVLALVVLFVFEHRFWLRLALLLMLAAMLGFLIVLESEGTYLALLLTACALMAVRFTGLSRGAFALCIVAGVFGYVWLMMRPETGHAVQGVSLGGFEIRSMINARLLELVADRPWFGYGINSFKYMTEAAVDGVMYIHPHQIYLEALFSFGIVGCVLFVAVLWGFFRLSSRHMILSEPLSMLGFLAAVYMAGKGLTDMKLMSVQPLAIFMLAAAFMAQRPSPMRPLIQSEV